MRGAVVAQPVWLRAILAVDCLASRHGAEDVECLSIATDWGRQEAVRADERGRFWVPRWRQFRLDKHRKSHSIRTPRYAIRSIL